MDNKLFVLCKTIIVMNIVFWSTIFIYFSFFKFAGREEYLFIKILLFFEPLFFLIIFLGVRKKNKLIYIFSIIFVFLNSILSITDEAGFYDFFSLTLNLLAITSLVTIRKQIKKNLVNNLNNKS